MSQPPRPCILVVDDDPAAQELITTVLSKEKYELIVASTGQEAMALALSRHPNVAIVDIMLSGMDGYTLSRQLRQNPSTKTLPILILTAKGGLPDKIAGFEAGADDYMTKPFHPAELAYRVKSLLLRSRRPGSDVLDLRPRGRVVTFFSTKGGVGKTMLSANLAVALQRANKRVAFFDADFFFGDAGVHLNLTPTHSVLDLVRHIDEIDEQLLEQVTVPHSTGLRILLSPFRPEQAELISSEHARKVVAGLADHFDYVIIDTQATYEERTLTILEVADDVMLVTTPEIGPLKNMRLFLDVAGKLGLPTEHFHVVLNRYDSNVGIKPDEIERALQRPIEYRIGSGGRTVVLSANRGIPIIMEQPAHHVSLQIQKIADALLHMPSPERRPEMIKDAELTAFPFRTGR